jgi:transposase
VLYTDTPWLQVPYRELGLPSGETCRRRLEEWSRRGLFHRRSASCTSSWPRPTARLVAGDRRCLAGRRKKGGEKVARTLRGSAGSRFHLAVDALGRPLAVAARAGNENEQRHLIPLLDALAEASIRPRELWADRGYASRRSSGRCASGRSAADQPTAAAGEPIPAGTPTRRSGGARSGG